MNLHPASFIVLILLSIPFSSHAQLEAANWYFGGKAGVDFTTGNPVALMDGELDTAEGSASISDALGNLQLYTDGITVWNRNHEMMLNGTGLKGHSNSTQTALIVPRPEDSDIYYIFTTDWQAYDNGMNYSIVDMSLDGGLGGITSVKNVNLIPRSTERLTAVVHANGEDIWVLSQPWDSNKFHAYLVTAGGLNTIPVESTTPYEMTWFPPGSNGTNPAVGQMKVSPRGDKLAVASDVLGVHIFDFDNATGMVSNMVEITNTDRMYGVEFSPSGKILYVSHQPAWVTHKLYQYNLDAPDIGASQVILADQIGVGYSLQLAIDGKIYGIDSNQPNLYRIENPDILGPGCNYVHDAVDLGPGRGMAGLPPFIQSFFTVELDIRDLCFGDITEFYTDSSEPVTSAYWDFGDGTTSTQENPTHVYSMPGEYEVSLTVTTASGSNTKESEITISEVPIAHEINDIETCQTNSAYSLDLSTLNPEILGTQNSNHFDITYFSTQDDADTNTVPLESVVDFEYGTTSIYARISNIGATDCYDITEFKVTVIQAPELSEPADWIVCDNDLDGTHFFDLTLKDAEVLNGQDGNVFGISYYGSQLDAENKTNPLATNHGVSIMSENVFYHIENKAYPECFETGSFVVGVIDKVVDNQPDDLEICDMDNDGSAQFDLSLREAQILGTQSASSVVITYHESQADADGNTNPLPNVITSNQYQKTIYVRVSNAQDISCYDTNSFQLNIYDVPEVPEVSDWQVCDDDNDGRYTFDLDEKVDEIIADVSGVSLAFYESEADATLEQNPIYGNYQNASNPQTVYFRLNNSNNTACYAVGSFDLEVFDAPLAYAPTDFVVCDEEGTDSYPFNLSQKDEEVLNGQDSSSYEVTYYSTEQDAIIGQEKLSEEEYFNVAMTETIYARVEHKSLSSCYDITNLNLIVNPLPGPDLQEVYVICPDSPDLVLDAGTFESYRWEDVDGNMIGNDQLLNVTGLGTYSLTVTEVQNGISCSNTVSFEVLSSGAPDSFEVTTDGLSDRITLTVDAVGTGDFEYSIDGMVYQSSNQFEVFPGEYTVYVRDPLGCRTISQDVIAIGYQKFFTPNGDGINEHWNIIGGELYSDAQLFLYDRYGKLLVQLSPKGSGWDGTILGRPMPSTDYWFKYVYDNGKTYSGHFSLRR